VKIIIFKKQFDNKTALFSKSIYRLKSKCYARLTNTNALTCRPCLWLSFRCDLWIHFLSIQTRKNGII